MTGVQTCALPISRERWPLLTVETEGILAGANIPAFACFPAVAVGIWLHRSRHIHSHISGFISLDAISGLKLSRFPGPTPSNGPPNGYCPPENHNVPRHINNRYFNSYCGIPALLNSMFMILFDPETTPFPQPSVWWPTSSRSRNANNFFMYVQYEILYLILIRPQLTLCPATPTKKVTRTGAAPGILICW